MALLNKLRKLCQPKVVVKYIIRKIYNIYIKYKIGNITIISNNCVSGFLYKKYGMRYYSPTIGLQFSQEDFVKLCENFERYMQEELKESENKMQANFTKLGGGEINFPVGKLGDIIIYFQHYKSFEDAKVKWDERKKRIDKNKLFFIFVGYNNTPEEVFEKYDKLPLKYKLLLTNERRIKSKNAFEMHNGKNSWYDEMENRKGIKYFEQINYYKWFMKGIVENKSRNNGT